MHLQMKLLFLILITLLITSNIKSQSTQIELRNFYTNKPLSGNTIFVNQNKIELDSLGQFSVPSSNDSLFINFLDFLAYPILVKNEIGPEYLLIYQFDKYLLLASSVWVRHKYFFGLVERKTYEGGPDEESNRYDIFRYRERITFINKSITYDYSFNNKHKEFLILKVERDK